MSRSCKVSFNAHSLLPPASDSLAFCAGYGLTETSPISHVLPPKDVIRKAGSIGVLLPNLEARIVIDGESDGLVDAAQGVPGELWIRGPTIMKVS